MLDKILPLLDEYYQMADGVHIPDFHEEIIVSEINLKIKIRKRALKHIIEQRKRDSYKLEDIINFFSSINEIILKGRYKIIKNATKGDNDFLLLELVENTNNGVVLVIEVLFDDGFYYIKTGFYRSSSKIKRMLSKIG